MQNITSLSNHLRQPNWEENEVILLLNTTEKIAKGDLERTEAISLLSRLLRLRLAAKGISVGAKTRNESVIHLQIHWMEIYLETGQAKNLSGLFVEIARLKANNPEKYAMLFRQAEEELQELHIDFFPQSSS